MTMTTVENPVVSCAIGTEALKISDERFPKFRMGSQSLHGCFQWVAFAKRGAPRQTEYSKACDKGSSTAHLLSVDGV